MAADKTPPDKLSIILYSGDFDRVHYGLVSASAAVASGKPVTLFFTMGATRALVTKGPDGGPGWHGLGDAEDGLAPADRDKEHGEKGVATFEELLEACVMLEVSFMVCSMGLRSMDLVAEDLRADVPVSEGGMVSFIADASSDGAILFI